MSQKVGHPERRSAGGAPSRTGAANARILIVAGVLGLVIVCVLGLFKARSYSQTPFILPADAPCPSVPGPMMAEFEKLKGKWLRPDGGYVLEIRKLLQDNMLEAAYFNPSPIHVGKARLCKERGFVKVFVELQDVNYPGSTYTLIYDADNDQLCGVYYQATSQQEYQIVFERLPPGS